MSSYPEESVKGLTVSSIILQPF